MKKWQALDKKGYLSSFQTLKRDDDRPLDFHGAFIPQVAEQLILRHTDPGDWVWDPFAGSGTTEMVARTHGRGIFSTDLNPRHDFISKGDARNVRIGVGECQGRSVPIVGGEDYFNFDLVILHPPYHNIIRFSENENDLSNCKDLPEFIEQFGVVCANVTDHVKLGGVVSIVIGDIWDKGWVPLGLELFSVAECMLAPCKLLSIVIKNIEGNLVKDRNLWLSRFSRWGTVEFRHEYIFSIKVE